MKLKRHDHVEFDAAFTWSGFKERWIRLRGWIVYINEVKATVMYFDPFVKERVKKDFPVGFLTKVNEL